MDSAGKRAKSQKPAHGPPLQPRVAAANGTVFATCHDDPGAHGLNRGQSNMNGASYEKGSGHGMAKVAAGKQSPPNRPLQATQPADNPTGTGLEEQTASSWPASQQTNSRRRRWPASQQNNSRRRRWPASRRAVQVDGGSAVVLATQEAGSDLLYLSPSHLSPLPVTVHTHSLNFEKPNLAPTYFFVVVCIFFLPLLPH